MTLEAAKTDYDSTTEKITGVTINGNSVHGECNPNAQCQGDSYHTCFTNTAIDSAISGTYPVAFQMTNSREVNFCPVTKGGTRYYAYVKLTISADRSCTGPAPPTTTTTVPPTTTTTVPPTTTTTVPPTTTTTVPPTTTTMPPMSPPPGSNPGFPPIGELPDLPVPPGLVSGARTTLAVCTALVASAASALLAL